MTPASSDVVVLRGGLSVPLAAVELLLDLETRGFTIGAESGRLLVRPASRLTASDERSIRRHRDALLALVRHCEAVE
jgi:hypothetical protein